MCSCLYVLLWGNFICRMHLQACIKFHKINLPNYFLITVSSHLYTYPTSCHQLVYELLFISDVHTNSCCLICYTILLIPTSSPKLIVVPGTFSWLSLAPETSQVHRIWPHHYTVWTETAALQHASCSCSFLWSELLSVSITLLWLNFKGFLCIILTVRLLPNAYIFFIELKRFNYR